MNVVFPAPVIPITAITMSFGLFGSVNSMAFGLIVLKEGFTYVGAWLS